MKIIVNENKNTQKTFSDVKIGEAFFCDGRWFIRTGVAHCTNGRNYNAVSLEYGAMFEFSLSEEVEYITSQMTITPGE